MNPFPWYKTIRFRIGLAVLALFFLHAGTAAVTLYEVHFRKHDYEILVLAGQLRVVSNAMPQQSLNYLASKVAGNAEDPRDLKLYYETLRQETRLYDEVITGYRNRRLPVELTGDDAPLTCSWDARSKNQLDLTAAQWQRFRTGLFEALGPREQQPDLAAAAQYIATHGNQLIASSDRLNKAFQHMMEGKLAFIYLINKLALALSAAFTLVILVGTYRKLVRPLAMTVKGFERVANGDLGYQMPVPVENEIGAMTVSFNRLSQRLRALFHLTDQINEGIDLYDTLRLVSLEFGAFLPVEWVGVFTLTPDRQHFSLERLHAEGPGSFKENDTFAYDLGLPPGTLETGRPLALNDLAGLASRAPTLSLIVRLRQDHKGSAVILPLGGGSEHQAVLVIASAIPGAYAPAQVAFLGNLAAQISHVLEKTLFMEGLVIAAVEGLAKLAESRDPETGGHLTRMSLYSALIAEELGSASSSRPEVTPRYIREVFRFAPMHDIGKVGIRDDILLKPGRLDPGERTEMERHPVIGGQVLQRCEEQMNRLGHSIFKVGIEIAECHHEKFDGSGYPKGLKGSTIPLSARIIAVADVFDALRIKDKINLTKAENVPHLMYGQNSSSNKMERFIPNARRARTSTLGGR
jgi:HD-GYP domain-containing protein (c-di-GMP phosphodiesterase class II)/HAMP domain-containing protein